MFKVNIMNKEIEHKMPDLTEEEKQMVIDEAETLVATLRPGSYGYNMAKIALAVLTKNKLHEE